MCHQATYHVQGHENPQEGETSIPKYWSKNPAKQKHMQAAYLERGNHGLQKGNEGEVWSSKVTQN